jgi:hypothetical protein
MVEPRPNKWRQKRQGEYLTIFGLDIVSDALAQRGKVEHE